MKKRKGGKCIFEPENAERAHFALPIYIAYYRRKSKKYESERKGEDKSRLELV